MCTGRDSKVAIIHFLEAEMNGDFQWPETVSTVLEYAV